MIGDCSKTAALTVIKNDFFMRAIIAVVGHIAGRKEIAMPQTLGCATPDLRWWKDFWAFQPTLFRALRKAPLLVAYLLMSTAVTSATTEYEGILLVANLLAYAALGCVVVFEVWAEITRTRR